MAKDTRNRVKLSFGDDELPAIDRLCKSYSRWGKRAASLHNILMELAETTDANREAGTRGHLVAPTGSPWAPEGPSGSPEVTCPVPASPSPLKNPDPEEEKKSEKKAEGESEGVSPVSKNAAGKKPTQSALVEAVTARVIKRVNDLRPSKHKFTAPPYRDQVKAILKKNTEMDIVTVVEWCAANCERMDDWEWFVPDTMLRIRSFAQKLDKALAGVEHGSGDNHPGATQQDFTPQGDWK